jgi:hypothetical protein
LASCRSPCHSPEGALTVAEDQHRNPRLGRGHRRACARVLSVGRKALPAPAALGIAGGLFFSIGDVSTKVVTTSGPVDVFVIALIAGYGVGTALLQLGYQTGGALTVAGLATLLSNAVPIVAGTVVLHEPLPSGPLGGLRALAFVAVSGGAFLLAQPDDPGTGRPVRGAGVTSARRSSHAA